jgi:regulator of chromosome condensation
VTLSGENKDGTMVAVAAGDVHTMYLAADGTVFMTGMYKDMDSGKFAHPTTPNGSPIGFRDRPVQVPMPQKVIFVTSGQSFNAAILEDGTMVTWGKFIYCVVSCRIVSYRLQYRCSA